MVWQLLFPVSWFVSKADDDGQTGLVARVRPWTPNMQTKKVCFVWRVFFYSPISLRFGGFPSVFPSQIHARAAQPSPGWRHREA